MMEDLTPFGAISIRLQSWDLNVFHEVIIGLLSVGLCASLPLLWGMVKVGLGSGSRTFVDHQALEGVWTAAPMVILIGISIPSLHLLYATERDGEAGIITKAIGHQ